MGYNTVENELSSLVPIRIVLLIAWVEQLKPEQLFTQTRLDLTPGCAIDSHRMLSKEMIRQDEGNLD